MTKPRVKPEQPEWLGLDREEAGKQTGESSPCRILILGVGESGNKTVKELIKAGVPNSNVDIVAIGTDVQMREIESHLNNREIVFVATGLSSRKGSAVAPVVAELAHKKGAIVVGFVSAVLRNGRGRVRQASAALKAMRRVCDTVVVIDNNKLMELEPRHSKKEAFKMADQVLVSMIQGIVETISKPSLVNLDFADFRNVVRKGGVAAVGMGESNAPNRAEEAVQNALRSPLFDADYTGATGALIHVVGDNHMTAEEANRVGEIVSEMMGHDTRVVWGARAKPSEDGFLKVTLVMTGVHSPKIRRGYGTLMPKLYDIESSFSMPETSLQVDLGLDQLENFGE